jgi:ribosomal protein S12 methylthiotransferase accessory factor
MLAGDHSGDALVQLYLSRYSTPARPGTMELETLNPVRSLTAGKGVTCDQAKASALCEALERYSAVFQGNELRRRGSLVDLGEPAIHPNSVMQFSELQYRTRREWNAVHPPWCEVPVEFDPSSVLDWTPLWSLTSQSERLLPSALCYLDYPTPRDSEPCFACSNGTAAGNTREEAILQGLFELLERDAVAIWWYNRVRRPALDLDSFRDPYVDRLRNMLLGRRRDFWVIDVTADLPVPVYVAISHRVDPGPEEIVLGFGAHRDGRIALLRAVTEMNQMLAPLLRPRGPSVTGTAPSDPHMDVWLRTASLADHPYFSPLSGPPVALRSEPSHNDDIVDDILDCRRELESRGLDLLVLDLTRPEIGLPVVRVVSGLRHFWPRFSPGRLFDVPVALGWLERPTPEASLNPFPMFL